MSNPNQTWQARLQDPNAWKKTLSETILWVIFTCLVIQLLRIYVPGQLFLVTTPSIPEGIYWRDTSTNYHLRGDITSFKFAPEPAWLKERYPGLNTEHSKRIVGLAGDTVAVAADRSITVCNIEKSESLCVTRGRVLDRDSKGRPLYSFVPLGTTYTIKQGEVWVMGDHPSSLDSRYQGPIPVTALKGRGHILIGW